MSAPITSVFSGQICLGFILARGPAGFEAFTSVDEKSLGLFSTQREAAAAIMRGVP
jgi:hypothetical protein